MSEYVIASTLSHGDAMRALAGAYPGEGFTARPGESAGLVVVLPDNPARTESDIVLTLGAWDAGALVRAKAAKVAALNARRAVAILAFVYSFEGDDYAVPLDAQTRLDVANAVAGLQAAPGGTEIEWEITDGVYLTWGLADLLAFGAAGFTWVQACYAYSSTICAEIQAAADQGELDAIDLGSGWPS